MTIARSKLVDEDVTPWYHCISRTVRKAFLLGEGDVDRKQWIEDRLRELCGVFAVQCAGFAVMDNHLHLLLRLDSAAAAAWSDEEIARRWVRLFPLPGDEEVVAQATEEWVQQKSADADWVTRARQRLNSLGWFMKCLKEPLARMANRAEGCTGVWQNSLALSGRNR